MSWWTRTAPQNIAVHFVFSKRSSHANLKQLWLRTFAAISVISFESVEDTGNQISPFSPKLLWLLFEYRGLPIVVSNCRAQDYTSWRYVDKWVLLTSQSSRSHSAGQSVLHSEFYGRLVQLELVQDTRFFRLDVLPESRQIKYFLSEE